MPDYSTANRTLIARYRFVDGLSYAEIASRVSDITVDGAKSLCHLLRARYPDASPEDLVQYAPIRHRKGKGPRIQPGSVASIEIRAGLRTHYRSYLQPYAGNRLFQQHTGEPQPPRYPFRELGAQQIHNIAQRSSAL